MIMNIEKVNNHRATENRQNYLGLPSNSLNYDKWQPSTLIFIFMNEMNAWSMNDWDTYKRHKMTDTVVVDILHHV